MSRIVDALRESPRIGEILVWNNNPGLALSFFGALTINSPKNFSTLARYALAQLVIYDTVWFQDDDLLVTPNQLELLWQQYEKDLSKVYGVHGRVLGPENRYVSKDADYGPCDVVLRAQLLHRREVQPMFALLPSPHKAPGSVDDAEDDLFLNLARGRMKAVAVDVGLVEDLADWRTGGIARWTRPDHLKRRQEAVDFILGRVAHD